MTALRLIQGGRLATVRQSDVDELRLEALAARAERVIATTRARDLLRSAMRNLAAGNLAVVGTRLVMLERINESESQRAMSMSVPACAAVKQRRAA